jgi:integrase
MAGGVSKRRLQSGKVRWRYYGSYSGRKFYSSAKYLNEGECLVARRQHLERLATKGTHHMKLGDCVRQRIEDIEVRYSQRYAVQSEAFLQIAIDRFGADIPLFDISRDQIQSLLNSEALRLKKAARDNYSVNQLRSCLHSLYQWAIDRWELQVPNPVTKIRKYPIQEKTKYIPEEWELELIEKNLNPKQRLLFLFCLQTGARIGECLNLRAKDLDFEKRLVTLWSRKAKGSSLIYRKVPMPLIMDEVRVPKSPNARIFKTWSSHPLFLRNAILRINKERAEAPDMTHWTPTWTKPKLITYFSWHNLRHACVSRLLTQGVPIYEVMVRVGHKNVMVTMAYAQLLGFTKFTLIEGYEVDSWDF